MKIISLEYARLSFTELAYTYILKASLSKKTPKYRTNCLTLRKAPILQRARRPAAPLENMQALET